VEIVAGIYYEDDSDILDTEGVIEIDQITWKKIRESHGRIRERNTTFIFGGKSY
jgi:hypothetical protein